MSEIDSVISTKEFALDRWSHLSARLEGWVRMDLLPNFLLFFVYSVGRIALRMQDSSASWCFVAFVFLAATCSPLGAILLPSSLAKLKRKRRYDLSEDSITLSVEGMGECITKWNAITHYSIAPKWTVLYAKRKVVAAIPREAIPSQDLTRFLELVARKRNQHLSLRGLTVL